MGKNYRDELVGVFGCPVDENPTGVIEEKAFAYKKLPYRYIVYKVDKDGLDTAMHAVRALNMRGINLTIPHKVAAVPYLDELSEAAGIIGAVNIIVNRGGILWGENTDGKGFLTSLRTEDIRTEGAEVTILGAGGAARAIAVECALSGTGKVTVINRDPKKGNELCSLIRRRTGAEAEYKNWAGRVEIPESTDILINGTSVGLYPYTDQKPEINYDCIHEGMAVCDVVFNDPRTLFLEEAKKRHAKTVNGLGMLVNQAALNFELWTGEKAPLEVMEQALREEFGL